MKLYYVVLDDILLKSNDTTYYNYNKKHYIILNYIC